MNIDVKDALVLDDGNTYIVTNKVKDNGKYYYLLLDQNNPSNFKFCYQDNDEVIQISDSKLIAKLSLLFFKDMHKS